MGETRKAVGGQQFPDYPKLTELCVKAHQGVAVPWRDEGWALTLQLISISWL